MKNFVIEKINGESFATDMVLCTDVEFDNLKKLYDFMDDDMSSNFAKRIIDSNMKNLFKSERTSDMVFPYYKRAYEVKNIKELKSLVSETVNFYFKNKTFKRVNNVKGREDLYSYYEEIFSKNTDYSYTTMIRRVIYDYFRLIIKEMPKDEFNNLKYSDINEIVKNMLEEKNVDYTANEEIFRTSILAIKNAVMIRRNETCRHLCRDCSVPILECPKLLDIYKKSIDRYDFITDGYQLWENGEKIDSYGNEKKYSKVLEFYVSGCTIHDKHKK